MQDKCESKGCAWEVTDDPSDCEMTTTATPGCCRGFSYKAQAKCVGLTDVIGCERMDCEWVRTEDPDDCEMTTTPPGCCRGSSYKAQPKCEGLSDQLGCERMDFEWVQTDDPRDCVITTSSTTETPGCCRAIPSLATMSHNENCVKRDSINLCARGSACEWLITDDDADCELTTTTSPSSTTPPPGCCYGDSYKSNGKCLKATEQGRCESNGCNWKETDDPRDCEMTTTSTSTTSEEEGCCKGEDFKSNQMCNQRMDRRTCERSSSCTFIVDGTIDKECKVEEEKEPGCCYGDTPKTNEMCAEKEDREMCERSGKCEFRSGEDADCSLPTTTSPPGCCRGSSYKAQPKCEGLSDQMGCERMSCEWVHTDDPRDCVLTTTSTSTTTETPGCCKGLERKNAQMCIDLGIAKGREMCDRSNKCEFIETNDAEDCEYETTTSEPWLNAQEESEKQQAYSQRSYSGSYSKKRSYNGKKSNAELFVGTGGTKSTVEQAMQTQVSLTTLLMLVGAAIALYQAYWCVAQRNGGGYKQIRDGEAVGTSPAVYQKV